MQGRFLRFFLILTFVTAQFFTEQVHELTHLLSHTACDQADAHQVDAQVNSLEPGELHLHLHCKFLRLVSQSTQPFTSLASQSQNLQISCEASAGAQCDYLISQNGRAFYKARAPPMI